MSSMSDYVFPVNVKFELSDKFLEQFKNKQPEWGPIGYITYKRTYARTIDSENRTEEFWETLKRVVEGCYTVQRNHCLRFRLPWNAHKSQKSAQEMFKLMWEFKFLPPGRGLWAMGTDGVYKKGSGALNNCAFVSTKDIKFSFSDPFVWLMDMCMLGVGVAFDTSGAGSITVREPKTDQGVYIVDDSKEGWCSLVGVVLDSYVGNDKLPVEIDYSKIRPEGALIKTFGGIAPGPEPLKRCVGEIHSVLSKRIDHELTSTDIVDLMNIIGKCVVSGGVRRTAELALGNSTDEAYTEMKDSKKFGDLLTAWRWASNNSVVTEVGDDYTKLAKQTAMNGEPGYVYLENIRKYGRLKDGVTWADEAAMGVNPCGEQALENYELCNLCELFPSKHNNIVEFRHTLKYAYLYAKTVTLIPTHCERTNQVMLRNRRIGLSMSGIIDAMEKFGRRHFFNDFCDKGYERVKELDKKYSRWLCVPESIKKTTVKPSGTVSLLPGVTSGIHYPHSEFYIRRVEVQKTSPLVEILKAAGYKWEQSIYKPEALVFEFPHKTENFAKSKNSVTIWEQMENAAQMQYYWSDNCISQTVTVHKHELDQIKDVLELFEDRMKTVSFLPLTNDWEQSPLEEITEERYLAQSKLANMDVVFDTFNKFNIIDSSGVEANKFCDGGMCDIVPKNKVEEKEVKIDHKLFSDTEVVPV